MARKIHLIAEDKEIFLSLCHVTMRDFVINLLQLGRRILRLLAISPSFNCGTGLYCDRINLLSNGSLKEILKINCSTNKS